MFCMNCGQQLPDGAKFCLNCGTPQGAISPTGTNQVDNINLDGMHTFVPAMCPNCNAHMKVDTSSKVTRCDTCGTECLVQDAIKTLTVRGNVQVGSATINVSGTNTDSLLQRVEIMLGDGDFGGAMAKCDTILDSDPTNGRVYFYMLMSNLHCRKRTDLATQKAPFDGNQYYLKAMQYGDPELKNELQGYINVIKQPLEAKQKNPKVWDEIYFGTQNGQRIWWKVLRIQDRMALIISSYNICDMPFSQPDEEVVTWSACSLRKWLNNDFFNGYFTPAEQSRILPCKLNNDTIDKVFLLSGNEVSALFDRINRKAARANESSWWLRSNWKHPDEYPEIECITRSGAFSHDYGHHQLGVRPVLWIKLDD